jgi:hypothetical protein
MDKDEVWEKNDILSHSFSIAGHTHCHQVNDDGSNT